MNSAAETHIPIILVHGGAYKIPEHLVEGKEQGVKLAAIKGYRVLKNGGSCVDAVVKAISSMEDDPIFDAGRGSVLNEAGDIEMHAHVMRGDTCDVGAVACIKHVRNPVEVAKIVLENTHHCLLTGESALEMARKHKVKEESFEYFLTEHSKNELKVFFQKQKAGNEISNINTGHDTVGAVALDCYGNLASSTSTGGITGQKVGRISDSPLVGSGGYADNDSVAVSVTGQGEAIMKANLSKTIACYVEAGMTPEVAAEKALRKMVARVGGFGGAISVDTRGRTGVYYTTEHMGWARIIGSGSNDVDCVEFGSHPSNTRKEKI